MSAAENGAVGNEQRDLAEVPGTDSRGTTTAGHYPGPALVPEGVEIRRNAGLAAVVGVLASGVAIAYLSRAVGGASVWEWVLALVTGLVGAGFLWSCVDARTPLLVADTQGVRIRLGRTWRGLPWGALRAVEHHPRRRLWQDGRLALVPHQPQRVLEDLDAGGRRQAGVAQRLYGAPFAVPLGLATRVRGTGEDLTTALQQLAGSGTEIVALGEPAPAEPASTNPAEEDAPTPGRTGGPGPVAVAAPADPGPAEDEEEQQDQETRSRRWAGWADWTDRWPQLDPRPWLARLISDAAGAFRRPLPEEETEPGDGPAGTEQSAQPDTLGTPGTGDVDDVTGEETGLRGAGEHGAVPGPDEHGDPVPGAAGEDTGEPAPVPPASPTPAAARESRRGRRAETTSQLGPAADAEGAEDEPGRELRRPGSVPLVEETEQWGDRVRPIATEGHPVEPIAIDDLAVQPAEDPVIGPEIAAARTRLSLTVDQLAERTRIRPHVLEAIEVDDFGPCGGDFYARGHLRTVARVLGMDATALLTSYDQRYAAAPIDARRVFEAELATASGGSIRGTRGGPSWSVLVALVMALVLAWSAARLVMDEPAEVRQQAPSLSQGSEGAANAPVLTADPVPVQVRAVEAGADVTVRNGEGTVVFSGPLSIGESRQLDVSPPVEVAADDAGVVAVTVAGEGQGRLGEKGGPGRRTFAP